MSRRITAGNDAPFRWAVKLQGKPFDLSGKDVKVYVINSRGDIPVARLTIEGNEVSGVFEGRYQTRLGEHSLVLRVNEGRPEMKTAAVANVFELVQWSADAGGSNEGDVIVAPVLIESELSIGMGGGSYDDTEVKEELARLEREKADKSELTELSAEVSKKQDTISDLETIRSGAAKGATAIQEVKTINGQSIVGSGNVEIQGGSGGGMTTPSGDPMHYMYEVVGAEWNGTGADIEKQGVYGDTITHKAGYWYLNELGDITTEEMRAIYAYSFPMQRRMNLETAFAKTPIRTNIAVWDADRAATFGAIAHSQADLRGVCAEATDMEIFAFIKGSQSHNIQKHIAHLNNSFNRAFYNATKLRKIIGYLTVASSTDYQTFMNAEMLEEVRMWKLTSDFSFAYCSKLSKASLLFAITNSEATKAITITLHADAYARLAEDADIVAALAEKTNVSLAK